MAMPLTLTRPVSTSVMLTGWNAVLSGSKSLFDGATFSSRLVMSKPTDELISENGCVSVFPTMLNVRPGRLTIIVPLSEMSRFVTGASTRSSSRPRPAFALDSLPLMVRLFTAAPV